MENFIGDLWKKLQEIPHFKITKFNTILIDYLCFFSDPPEEQTEDEEECESLQDTAKEDKENQIGGTSKELSEKKIKEGRSTPSQSNNL